MLRVTGTHPVWEVVFFLIGIAQGVLASPKVYRFENAQVLATDQDVAGHSHPLRVLVGNSEKWTIKYVFLDSDVIRGGHFTGPEPFSIDLPHLPSGDWNEASIRLDQHTCAPSINNTTKSMHLGMADDWHPRKIEYVELVKVRTLQPDRLQVVSHPDFDAPVLAKIASFPWDIPPLEREAMMYRLLYSSGIVPEFLGHVTEDGRIIGFMTEFIHETPSIRIKNLRSCQDALRRLHQRGIAHGDAHGDNCLIRNDGSAVLIDFELSIVTSSEAEFNRDLEIMDRCIRANSMSSQWEHR